VLADVLRTVDPVKWSEIDITLIYNQARKFIFKTCKPKIIWVPVGGSFIIHRLCLHGVGSWDERASSERSGRMIAYFRPNMTLSERWLDKEV
jgi:hypothetical protein